MADLTITAANVIGDDEFTEHGIAGETITAGMPVYLKESDSRLWKAQADGTAAEAAMVGIALHAATAAQPLAYQTEGDLNIGATTAKTTAYMVSTNAGGICPQADLVSTNRIVYVGYARDTSGAFTILGVDTGVTV